MLKHKLFLACILLLIVSVSFGQAIKKKDLNPNYSKSTQYLGGVATEGSLKISIFDDGDMQIARYFSGSWQNQWYGTNSKSFRIYADGIGYIGNGGYFSQNSPQILTTISNTLTDANTSVLILEYSGKLRITQTIYYPPGAAYYDEKWEIQNIGSSSISDLRFFTGGDTYLYGGDNAAGFWMSENNVIGCQKMINANQQQNLYLQGISIPYAYESQNYYGVYQSICNGYLSNTIDPNEYTDNGMALEWRTSNLGAGQTWTIDAVEKFILKTLTNIEVSAPLSAQVIPGGYIDMVFSVNNRTSSSTNVSLNSIVDLAGWTAVVQSPVSPFELPGNASQEVIVRVSCPSGTSLGSVAKVTLEASDLSGTAADFGNVEAAQVPSINAQPSDVNLCSSSGPVSFVVNADNADSYEWQEYTSSWSVITNGGVYSGAFSNTLNISDVSGKFGNQYRCRVINAYGSVYSNTVGIQGDEVDPEIPVLEDLTAECSVTVTYPSTNDNCAGTVTGTTSNPLYYDTQGHYIIVWNFDDGNGNAVTANQNVFVEDNTDPVPDVENLNIVSAECSVSLTEYPTATDNCAGTITATTNDPLTYNSIGSYMITWLYDDGNGNTALQTQNVVIYDLTPPVPDLEILPDILSECSVTISEIPAANDNCTGSITATTYDPLSYNGVGTYTVNWLFDDGNGNTSTQMQTVIINDLTAPEPDIENLPDILSECSVTISEIPTAYDNCTGSITASTNDPLSYSGLGTYTVNWLYDDGNGNTATQTQTVIINDLTAPEPDIENLPDILSECSLTISEIPTAYDNCAGSITASTNDPLSYNGVGTYTVNWLYDDGNGNTSTQMQTVIIYDLTPPVPDLEILPDILSECSVTLSEIPTAYDNCAGSITASTNDPLSYNGVGTYTVNWLYDDGNGNTSTQMQTVIINDITAPEPDIENLPYILSECSITISEIPTAYDNCAGSIIATTSDPLTYNSLGSYMLTWLYDDGNGNTVTQTQTVIINDLTAPEPDIENLPDILSECSVTISEIPTAYDNCAGSITASTNDPLSYNGVGTYTVNWLYDDGNGNMSTQMQTVIINDLTPPVPDLEILPDILSECTVTLSEIPTAYDNCAGSITATTNDPLSYNGVGTYTVNWLYDDGNGNTSTQMQTVIIYDLTPPVPDLEILPDILSECSVTISEIPAANDNCTGSITATTYDPLSYNGVGTYTVNWLYDDGNGNLITQTQTVIIYDLTAPEPDIETLEDVIAECFVYITDIPTASDNCSGTIVATTNDPLKYGEQGKYEIKWEYADQNGNSTYQIQNVIIKDSDNPIINCVESFTFNLREGETDYVVLNTELDPVSVNDNCTIAGIYNDYNALSTLQGAVFPIGLTRVTWTVEDIAGNTGTCTTDITINKFTSIENFNFEGIKLYPNPAGDFINIETSLGAINNICIKDITGKVLIEDKNIGSSKRVELTSLSQGIYFITISMSERNITTKFIKK